jgi:lipopolysaccharide/colanic/teichoic acid biosynthesis glycosyltransferase
MKEDDVLRVRDYLEHIELAIARIRRYLACLDRASFLAMKPGISGRAQVNGWRGEQCRRWTNPPSSNNIVLTPQRTRCRA